MKTLPAVAAVVLALSRAALAAEIADIPWTNIELLRSFDKTSVQTLVNRLRGDDPQRAAVGEFGWYDLAGDGRLELIATEDTSGRAFFDSLVAYEQTRPGKIVGKHWIEGYAIGPLDGVVKDLDGDGRKELLIRTLLGGYAGAANIVPNTTWVEVYRLKDGTYVEASGDFPHFYDEQILPRLEHRIAKLQEQAATIPVEKRRSAETYLTDHSGWSGPADRYMQWLELVVPQWELASAIIVRDKILRVLGRDREAGLQQAREWIRSADPVLVGDSIEVLSDMGGHEQDLREAKEAGKRIVERDREAKARAAAGR